MNNNNAYFQKNYPDVWKLIQASRPKQFKSATCRDGRPTLKNQQDAYLHSPYDPDKEAVRKLEQFDLKSDTTVILVGLGAGYYLNALAGRAGTRPCRVRKIMVIEPFIECLAASLAVVDYEEIGRSLNLAFCLSPETVAVTIGNNFDPITDRAVVTIVNENEFAGRTDLLARLNEDIKYSLEERLTFNAVVARFGLLWWRNFHGWIKKELPFTEYRDVTATGGRTALRRAIIIGSGPTLDDDLRTLPLAAESAAVFAADSAYKVCRSAGIRVDVAGSVDPQPHTGDFFKNVAVSPETFLLTDTIANPAVLEFFQTIILAASDHPLNAWLKVKGYITTIMPDMGGSVVIPLINLALSLGFREIIIVGVDSGFTGNKMYTGGIDQFIGVDRFHNPVITGITRPSTYEIETVAGGTILTTHNLDLYRQQIQRIVEHHPDINFYQVSGKSARINGTRYRPLSDFEVSASRPVLTAAAAQRTISPDQDGAQPRRVSRDIKAAVKLIRNCRDRSELINQPEFGRVFEVLVYAVMSQRPDMSWEEIKTYLTDLFLE